MFGYLTEILTITFTGFAFAYPLFLWLTPRPVIDGSFYRFNLGLTALIAGMGTTLLWIQDINYLLQLSALVWLVVILSVAAFYWRSESASNILISVPSIFGILVLNSLLRITVQLSPSWPGLIMAILSSGILANALFAMILGHWYLNVVHLPIAFLKRTTILFGILLSLRFLWNLVVLFSQTVEDRSGVMMPMARFIFTFDGFFLSTAIFFGLLVPLVLTLFTWRTLRLQATQSATGLLYVNVIAILFGDLFYKYYLFQYGFVL